MLQPQWDEMIVHSNGRVVPSQEISQPPAFVQTGRSGDLIQLMPAWKAWADFTGEPTKVVSTREFGAVLEGASYIAPTLLAIDWRTGIQEAIKVAATLSPYVVVTQLHGANWSPTEPDDLASYSLTMWKRTGFLRHYADLPLVFDKRDAGREATLLRRHVKTKLPLLLVNLEAWTSPMRHVARRLITELLEAFAVEVVHLNKARAVRVYDQIALMDIAAGMITCDTMPLHLASASTIPYVALVRDEGQSASIPKGNCVLRVGYSEVLERLDEIEATFRDLLTVHQLVHA